MDRSFYISGAEASERLERFRAKEVTWGHWVETTGPDGHLTMGVIQLNQDRHPWLEALWDHVRDAGQAGNQVGSHTEWQLMRVGGGKRTLVLTLRSQPPMPTLMTFFFDPRKFEHLLKVVAVSGWLGLALDDLEACRILNKEPEVICLRVPVPMVRKLLMRLWGERSVMESIIQTDEAAEQIAELHAQQHCSPAGLHRLCRPELN